MQPEATSMEIDPESLLQTAGSARPTASEEVEPSTDRNTEEDNPWDAKLILTLGKLPLVEDYIYNP